MSYRLKNTRKSRPLTLEEAVVACSLQNDDRGKEYIYKKFYGYVMAVILRYVKNEYDAEELVNESFMRAFKNTDRFKGASTDENSYEKSFKAWLARIAANISIDHLRAQKQLLSLDDVAETEFNSLRVNASDHLQVADILKLLEELPEIQRIIFNMFEIEGYSHDEIAKQLTIPESTSRTYLTRAKQKLRKLYLESVAAPLKEDGKQNNEG